MKIDYSSTRNIFFKQYLNDYKFTKYFIRRNVLYIFYIRSATNLITKTRQGNWLNVSIGLYRTEIDVGLNPDGAVSTLGITNVPWLFFVVREIPGRVSRKCIDQMTRNSSISSSRARTSVSSRFRIVCPRIFRFARHFVRTSEQTDTSKRRFYMSLRTHNFRSPTPGRGQCKVMQYGFSALNLENS